jgi:hypothetical protein
LGGRQERGSPRDGEKQWGDWRLRRGRVAMGPGEIWGSGECEREKGDDEQCLKPENFLFTSAEEDAALKATDFSLSVFYKPGTF